jgi:hypothetical protein
MFPPGDEREEIAQPGMAVPRAVCTPLPTLSAQVIENKRRRKYGKVKSIKGKDLFLLD